MSLLQKAGTRTFPFRVDKTAVNLFGRSMKMKVCKDPNCSMADHAGMAGLDRKGRNFCPSCETEFRRILGKRGIATIRHEPPPGFPAGPGTADLPPGR